MPRQKSPLPGGIALALLLASTASRAAELPAAGGPADPPPAAAVDLKELSLEELLDVDVTSVSKRSERLTGAAAAVAVVTAEDIRRSGVTTLPEALRLAAGLAVARFDSRTWAVSARGFNLTTANKLLVLIDGRSVYTPLFSGVFWDVQDVLLADVDRIEVIRGPGATLWGANAVNGVINILTKRAADTQGSYAEAGAGDEERGFGAFRRGGRAGARGWYRAYAKYTYLDALEFANGAAAEDPLRRGQGGFRADWEASDADAFTLQGDLYRGLIGQAFREDTDVAGGNLLGRWSRELRVGSDLRLQVYYDRTHRRVPGQFAEDLDTWDLDLQHRLQLGRRHDLVWGVGYRLLRDDVEDSPLVAWAPDHRATDLLNVFVQDEIALLADRLRLTVGSKLEHNDYTGFELQPSVRAAWSPDGRRTLWGAVSRAVRSPTRIDTDVRFLVGPTVFLRGGPDFESEDLLAWELGYRVRPRPRLSLDLATFYNLYDDLRSQEPQPGGGLPIVLGNRLEAETYGAELAADFQATARWRLHGDYAYLHEHFRLDPGSRDPTGGRSEGNDPRHRFALRSSLDLPREVEIDAWLRRVDELPAPRVPGYTELDLRLGWRPTPRVDLSLVGRNLLHPSHPEFGPPAPIRQEVERSVYGKVAWRF